MANVSALLERPHVRAPGEPEDFWAVYHAAGGERVRGNDVPDAHLVTLMRAHGVGVIYTRDRGFRRFDDVEQRDPIG